MREHICRRCGGVKPTAEPPMTDTEREAVANGWDLETFRHGVAMLREERAEEEAAMRAATNVPDAYGHLRHAATDTRTGIEVYVNPPDPYKHLAAH